MILEGPCWRLWIAERGSSRSGACSQQKCPTQVRRAIIRKHQNNSLKTMGSGLDHGQ
jgi:hypothetical protein